MKLKQKKDQFIIALITDFGNTDVEISWARFIAAMLKKGIILLHICDPRRSPLQTDEAEQELQGLIERSGLRASGATYAALRGDSRAIITALPTLMNAVAVTARVDPKARRRTANHPKTLLKDFAECKTAFLVAQEPLAHPEQLRHMAFTVDFRKESKDKFIWSSYFPRFGNITSHVLYYDYSDEFLKRKWYANMQQLHKLYASLNIGFQPHIISSKSIYPDVNALSFCAESGIGLLLSVTTKEKDGLEFFIGVQEERTIVNHQRIPILFLNPREDLYVLCD